MSTVSTLLPLQPPNIYTHGGVDQKKAFGTASIASQPRINRFLNGVNHGRVLLHPILFCSENRQNMAIIIHITEYIRDMTWARAYSGWLNDRGSIDFIDIFWKLNSSGFLHFELCCSDCSLISAIGYYYWAQLPDKPEYKSISYNIIVLLFQYCSWFSYNKCLFQSRTNRDAGSLMLKHIMPVHNS